jgi:hypothetical protein
MVMVWVIPVMARDRLKVTGWLAAVMVMVTR